MAADILLRAFTQSRFDGLFAAFGRSILHVGSHNHRRVVGRKSDGSVGSSISQFAHKGSVENLVGQTL